MDDRNLNEIVTRLKGLYGTFIKLQLIASVHKAGTTLVGGLIEGNFIVAGDIPLTTAQKKVLKSQFTRMAEGAERVADKLLEPTGLAGMPLQPKIDEVEANPGVAVIHLRERFQQLKNVADSLELDIQADNTYRFIFPAASAEKVADMLATVRDTIKFAIGVERLKVG